MQAEEIRAYFLSFPEATEETPFDANTVVYKTAGKMFALTNWSSKPLSFNLKCDPELAEKLRDQFECVVPGYHMNKAHWNTVTYDGSVEDGTFRKWVDHSFECVVKGMSKTKRESMLEQWQQRKSALSLPDPDALQLRASLRKGI